MICYETINYEGHVLDLEFLYEPAVPPALEDPGEPEYFELTSVHVCRYGRRQDATAIIGPETEDAIYACLMQQRDARRWP